MLRHLAAGALCRPAASITIAYDGRGSPRVLTEQEAPLFCSVAARHDLAAVALSPHRIGVDLEPVVDGPVPWAMLSPAEAQRLGALDAHAQLAAFLPIWTLKEAYGKARGIGLRCDPAGIDISFAPRPVIRDRHHGTLIDSADVRGACIGSADVVAACVVLEPRS